MSNYYVIKVSATRIHYCYNHYCNYQQHDIGNKTELYFHICGGVFKIGPGIKTRDL